MATIDSFSLKFVVNTLNKKTKRQVAKKFNFTKR